MKNVWHAAGPWALAFTLLGGSQLVAQESIVIEAEDFNFDGGQFIEDAGIGDYAGSGVLLGMPNVDFKENTPGTRLGNEATEGYRAPAVGSPGLPQTVISGDAVRADYTAAGEVEFDLASIEAGEWTNYTRVFPAGDYSVRARLRASDDPESFIARLEKVSGDATEPGQSTTAVGTFLGRNASMTYDFLPLTDVSGTPVTVSLDGTETLRLATQVGSYDINYLELTPSNTAVPMPTINIIAPANETGVQPGSDLDVVIEVGDPDNTAAVQLLANSSDGEEITIGELAEPPFNFTWESVPEGSYRLLGIVAANDNGLIGLSSQITIFSDGTAPELQQARGRTIEDVVLTFSEAMSQETAGDPVNYSIVDADGNALAVTGVTVELDGRVLVGTAEQSVGTNYTITTSNLTDLAGNALTGSASAEFFGNGPLLQTDLGFVVFEAEHYDRNLDDLWMEDTERGNPSGGVSMVNPNGAGGSEAETQLEYDIKFVKTGTHYFWYRASGDNGNDDSAWLWVDGARPVGREDGNRAAMAGFSEQLDFVWRSQAFEGGPMTFEINSTGLHTIGLARREDGSFFDKFVITTDPNFDPTDLGEEGPALTPREGEESEAGVVEVTLDPVDVSGDEHSRIELTADGTGSEGFIIIFQWQRKEGDTFVDIPGATLPSFTLPRATLDWDGAVVRFAVRTEGAEVFSEEATITVNPETVVPELVGVSGQNERVILQFSERLTASAENVDNYGITSEAGDLAITGITFLPSERAVILDTAPQTVGTKYSVTVSGIMDQAATPNIIEDTEAKFYSLGAPLPQGEDGLLVFEAENFTENSDGLWISDSEWGNPSGGLSMVLPNGAGGNEESKLEYELTFTQTGEHIIWYRASGPSGTDDSGWLHIDGVRPESRTDANLASMTGFADQTDFVWRSQPQEGGGQMTFNIPSAGVYNIGLARREDGSYFDKFVITTDPDFHPENVGAFGPGETREGAPPLPTLAIAAPATVAEGGDVVVTPDISQTERDIVKVEYFADGEKIGEVTSSPFTFTWTSAPSGFHTIQAVLVDDVGDRVTASPIEVTVEGDGGGDVPTVDGAGRSVLWVSQLDSPAGQEFLDFLRQSDFDVTEVFIEEPNADDQAMLNAADVVVVSRKTSSGNYNHEVWDTGITAPLILMTPYLSRANRWGWLDGDDLIDDTPASILAEMPEHPVFQGLVLTDGVSDAWHTPVDRGTSIATEPVANGGTVLASADGNMIVAEWPADTVAAGPRLLFSAGSREPEDPADIAEAGKFNLTATGGRAFLNAVLYMADLEGETPPAGDLAIAVTASAGGVLVTLSGADVFDVEYSPSLEAGSFTVIATDVTEFEDTDPARIEAGAGFYRGVAK